jgi:O-antigen/teichoic acid export membrane protein
MVTGGTISLLISVSVARFVGVEDFGIYSILVSMQNMIGIVAGLEMRSAIAKYISEHQQDDREAASEIARIGMKITLVFSTACAIIYLSLAQIIAEDFYHVRLMIALIPISAVVVMTSSIYAASMGIAQGYQRMRLIALMQILTPTICLVGVVTLAHALSLKGVLLAYLVAQTVASAIILTRIRQNSPQRTRSREGNRALIRRILGFAIPAVIAAALVVPVFWIGNSVLALSSDFEAMGHFAVAIVVYNSVLTIPQSIVVPLMPKISESFAKSRARVSSMVERSTKGMSVLLFPLIFAGALFSQELVKLVFGVRYAESANAVYLILIAVYLSAQAAMIGAMIVGTGRMWIGLGLNAIWAAAFLTLVFILVPSKGIVGLGAAFVGSYSVHLMTSYFVSARYFQVVLTRVYSKTLLAIGFLIAGYIVVGWHMPSDWIVRGVLLAVASLVMIWRESDLISEVSLEIRSLRDAMK